MTTTQPRVHPTYPVDAAPPVFSRVVGGPVSNTNRLEVACPQPIYPLPKWIDTTGWEEDEENPDLTSNPVGNGADAEAEEDNSEEFDVSRRFLPSFILSPDPEDLPAPFFPTSRDPTPSPWTLASLSPDACDLPQPRFDSDPPVFAVNSRSNTPGIDPRPSLRFDSFGSIVSPDPEDLPPPIFGSCARFEARGLNQLLQPPDCNRNRVDERAARAPNIGWSLGDGLLKFVTGGGGRKVSGSRHHRKWLGWT
jgi:hypothetical protein